MKRSHVLYLLFATVCLSAGLLAAGPIVATSPRVLPDLPPFLEYFHSANKITVSEGTAHWIGANGSQSGILARAEEDEPLPALIFLVPQNGMGRWQKQSVLELAGIGYVVLAVELPTGEIPADVDEAARQRILADLTAAVRHLRNDSRVLPRQMGAIGWGVGGAWALQLAATSSLEACVLCNSPLESDAALLAGLRHSAVMTVSSRTSIKDRLRREAFHAALQEAEIERLAMEFPDQPAGFMDSTDAKQFDFDSAERAWFEIYEFFAEHVEDAPLKALHAEHAHHHHPDEEPIATIAQLMRSVNAGPGLRGQVARALADGPSDEATWKQLQARAALMAEAGGLLHDLEAPRGSQASWRRQALAYQRAAESIAAAAGQRDLEAGREAIKRFAATCAACHLKHR